MDTHESQKVIKPKEDELLFSKNDNAGEDRERYHHSLRDYRNFKSSKRNYEKWIAYGSKANLKEIFVYLRTKEKVKNIIGALNGEIVC